MKKGDAMYKMKNKQLFLIVLIGVLFSSLKVSASERITKNPLDILPKYTPNYIIEYGPRTPNDPGDLGAVQSITDYASLKAALESSTPGAYVLTQDITFPTNSSQASITIPDGANKELDLNTHSLFAGTVGQITVNSQYFKMKNGFIKGGYTSNQIPNPNQSGGFVYSSRDVIDTSLVFEDITHESYTVDDTARGGFVVSWAGNIFFSGDNKLTNGNFNIKGGNVTFLPGNFTGTVTVKGGNPEAFNQGSGTVNIGFPGQDRNVRRPDSATTGDRRITVEKGAYVDLTNPNTTGANNYTNSIANWSVLTIDGSLKIHSYMPAMRTIAAELRQTAGYGNNDAQTYNGMANINVNEGGTFLAESLNPSGVYGNIYTYNVNINANNPSIFDLRYFGNGNFFYSYNRTPNSNMNLYNMDFAVWEKASQGIGNPITIWQQIDYLKITSFWNGNPGTIEASPDTNGLGQFNMNLYSRISNDVTLPNVILDNSFKLNTDGSYDVPNGSDKLFGTSNYLYPDKSAVVNKVVTEGTVDLYLNTSQGTKTKLDTTTIQSDGSWSFDSFKDKRYKASDNLANGQFYSIRVTDSDQRYGDTSITITDTLPPEATTKLYKFKKGTTGSLDNPFRNSVASSNDESSAQADLTYRYVLTEQEKEQMINTPGYYEVQVGVKDKAQNEAFYMAPIIVYDVTNPSTYFVSGQDFSVDFDVWNNTTNKRDIIVNPQYGNAKGYSISGDTVTDITSDTTQFIVTIPDPPSGGWQPESKVVVNLKAGNYSQDITVTLNKKSVNMNIHQVYKKDNTKVIYNNIENETQVDTSSIKSQVDMGSSIQTAIDNMIADNNGKFSLNYDWYQPIEKTDYKVLVNGVEDTSGIVPDKDFDVYFEYEGLLNVVVPDIDYGQIKITSKDNEIYSNPNPDSKAKITNTTLDSNWKLSVALQDGIHKTTNRADKYLGGLVFNQGNNSVTISDTSVSFYENQETNPKLLTNLPLDISLYQNIGNSIGTYSGDLIWTLQDGANP